MLWSPTIRAALLAGTPWLAYSARAAALGEGGRTLTRDGLSIALLPIRPDIGTDRPAFRAHHARTE
jgi:hypothetical protein